MFKSGEISPQTIEPYVNKLAVEFQNKGKQGFFVLCWTPQSKTELKDEMKDIKREIHFYEDLQNISYAKGESKSKNFDKAETEIENQLKGEESAGEEPTTQEVQTPAPQPQSEETKPEIVEEPSKTPKFDEAEKEVLNDKETEATPQKQDKSQPQPEDKSSAKESEEDDPWISEKLNLLKQKGLI